MCRLTTWSVVLGCSLVAALAWLPKNATSAEDAPPLDEASSAAVLHLTNGDFVRGTLRDSNEAQTLRWHCDAFTQPLDFPLATINAVNYAHPETQPKPQGEYCFELSENDVVYGNLLSLTGDVVEIDSPSFGRLKIQRAHIRRFYRWKGADLLYLGPDGLTGWTDCSAERKWSDEGGQPFSDTYGASLVGDFGIPAQAVIEFDLSWKKKPDFTLALGVDDALASVQQAFRVEVWDTGVVAFGESDIVVLGESERDADVAQVQKVGKGPGRLRLRAYLDQQQQRLLVFSSSGQSLASLRLHSRKPNVHPGLRLTNKRGDVRLERLRISRWNGVPPHTELATRARMHKSDGSIVYGELTAFDAAKRQFTVRDGKTDSQVSVESIVDVFLSVEDAVPNDSTDPFAPLPDDSADPPVKNSSRMLRVSYQDGTRFSGTLAQIGKTHLSLQCPAVSEPMQLPLAALRSLVVLNREAKPKAASGDGRPGRLELEGVRLRGRLVTGEQQPDAGPLVWRADSSSSASPLRHGVSGRIVYRDPPPPTQPTSKTTQVRRARQAGFGQIFKNLMQKQSPPVKPTANSKATMHLRSGDTIPCEVARIDEQGVTFKTPLSDATFVAHEEVKALELTARARSPRLDKIKRERLLTLPRLLKNSPPTHLVCSATGDFLRGRVMAMDASRLKVEVRLETKDLPRNRVSQLIWLHADELTGETPKTKKDFSDVTRVQTLRRDGKRFTFVASKWDGKTLSGTSEILGACRADLTGVDQLLFGSQIEQSAARLAYHRWKLHHATEPQFVQAGEGDSSQDGPTGTSSPLVGQAAPEFTLDLLDGESFRLSDRKGRVVVLDFWATWCGPCLQTMPVIEEVVGEFADDDVDLIAVNMEEQPKQITSMLERHKMNMTVALDRDGVVAARYAVTAIPQTVVIDAEGNVARLFVGGGPKLADPLRAALKELTGKKDPPATKDGTSE